MVTRFAGSSHFNDVVSFRHAMDRLVSESVVPGQMRSLWSSSGSEGRSAFPLDIYATDDALTVLAAVPGVDPDKLEISINKGEVTLKGSIPNVARSHEAKDATWYVHELPRGNFHRSIPVPFEIDADAAGATFDNGMLRLTLPKAEAARPRQIKVRVGSREHTSEALAEGDATDGTK